MADNKQNSENKSTTSSSGGAASTKQAKEENSAAKIKSDQTESSAKDTINKVKDTAGTIANQAAGQVKEKAASVIDEQKSHLASGITGVADSIRQIGENVGGGEEKDQIAALAGKYSDSLANQVEKISSYIDDRDIRELVKDVEQFARRNPLLFVGGAFALGVLAARFLKSSGGRQTSRKRS